MKSFYFYRSHADKLKQGENVPPEVFECATVFFSDVVGFTSIASDSTPVEVVELLNDFYSYVDDIIERYNVYKVIERNLKKKRI